MERYVLRTMRLGAVLVFTLTLIGCQKKSLMSLPSPSSVEAYETSAYPAVVKVILPGGKGLCSGTFISPRAVLTAAHCTLSTGSYMVVASFGSFITSSRLNYGAGVVDDPNDISLLMFDRDVADPDQGQVATLGDSVNAGEILRLVGFGCKDLETRRGTGVKRTGTNMVYEVNDYIELLTPRTRSESSRRIIGSDNRAGACFGDSGGPAAEAREDGTFIVKGVAHTGGELEDDYISDYVNISRGDNRAFLANANRDYNLGIHGL